MMPRREDINTILVLGSGPIKIGQAAEFDFSGSQAVRALREDGYEVILVNSNPATIQNDPEMADRVYIEPLLPDTVRKILEIEKPDALLAGMGGQTALNIASELSHDGTLEKLGVELIGSDLDAIDKAEDRELFNQVCESIDLPISQAIACNSMEEVIKAAEEIGSWPILIRPAFTLGGLGEELRLTWGNLWRSQLLVYGIQESTKCLSRNPFLVGKSWNTKLCETLRIMLQSFVRWKTSTLWAYIRVNQLLLHRSNPSPMLTIRLCVTKRLLSFVN